MVFLKGYSYKRNYKECDRMKVIPINLYSQQAYVEGTASELRDYFSFISPAVDRYSTKPFTYGTVDGNFWTGSGVSIDTFIDDAMMQPDHISVVCWLHQFTPEIDPNDTMSQINMEIKMTWIHLI